MDSEGVFREGDIDGKSFLIYTLLSQKVNLFSSSSASVEAAIDSGGDNDLPPLFLCPTLRVEADWLKKKELLNFVPLEVSPYFPSVDQNVQYLLDSNSHGEICKLPVLPLFWCNNEKPNAIEFFCGACESSQLGTHYHICVTCEKMFHKECLESPFKIKHPSYPFSSLKLHTCPDRLYSFKCIYCETYIYNMFYHCPSYNVCIHPTCAMKPIPFVIDYPKRHPHPLKFFPKQSSLACNVCGLVKEYIPTYVCVQCVLVVHQDCAYFPYVIRISRHEHRLSFTSSLPSRKLSCGICRQKIDNNYSAYSCNKCDDYFVHSRCAVRRDLWDGEELDGVPEEPEIVVEPFEQIADGIILHFSHSHNLKLEISRVYDDDKFCQACILPIYEGYYYSCVDHCDFILHEACTKSPLKKHHPLYALSLMLKHKTNKLKGGFSCDACRSQSFGFVYESLVRGWGFRLDIRCASVSEPFEYQGHEHPLFLSLTPEEERSAICRICQDPNFLSSSVRKLNCIECDYVICFKCATYPYKARYKHDKHLLTFRERKEGSDESDWCEVCETKLVYSRQKGYYACDNYCCTTLHVDCLLGIEPYAKPGHTIPLISKEEVHFLRNNTMSRPFCHAHGCGGDRCPYRLFFKRNNKTFCCYRFAMSNR